MSNCTYKRNFLNPVIFRLDFPIPIRALEEGGSPDDFHRSILDTFPIREEQKIVSQAVQFGPEGIRQAQRQETNQFNFFDTDKKTQLGLSSMFIFVQQTVYYGFEEFEKIAHTVTDALFKIWPDTTVNRLGLRYNNDIDIPNGEKPTEWSDYINQELLAPLKLVNNPEQLSRFLVTAETRAETYRSRIVTGMPNPDYPGAIRQHKFLVDIDIYIKEAISQEDVKPRLSSYHEVAVGYFEQSITDAFREYLDKER